MKKKTIIIICIILLAIFIPVYAIYVSFNGRLSRKITVTKEAKEYIAKNYPEQEWDIAFATYDFKCNVYSCEVQSPISQDTTFQVFDTKENVLNDDYETRVTNKDNTIWRIAKMLDDAVDERIMPIYPHRSRLMMADFYNEKEFDPSDFELDMDVDLMALPHPATFTFWVETSQKEPTWEEAAELLREAVQITEKAGIDLSYYSISVEYPYEGVNGELMPTNFDSIVGAFNVPKEVILGNGLEELLDKERISREQELLDLEKEPEVK